jgi:hypothetical protein
MFRVENADFIADKLAAELLPNQEYREVLKNALEAIQRRIRSGDHRPGRIEFDVDWHLHSKDPSRWYISCSDNGDGMRRSELDRYTTTLAVQGAGQNQSIYGNQGMGLKISGPTRHKRGILIRSMKSGERTMVQIGWDGREYGLIPLGANGELVLQAPQEYFPTLVNDAGSGTIVTFLGSDDDNTFVPAGRPKGWLLKYLNTRFFRLSQDDIDVLVRVPSGDSDDWPHTPEGASERMRKRGGPSFNLTIVDGTAPIWDAASDKQGEGYRGTVSLPGNQAAEIPAADIHWWVLPTGPGSDVSSRTASGGSLAVLYDNELHDWRTSNQANPFFARLGVLFGKTRLAFVLAPIGAAVTSDFARAHVLVNGTPVLESDAWLHWAEQFRGALPQKIREIMAEEQARVEEEDPDRVKRIRDRLKDVMRLLRPRRFRKANDGQKRAKTEVLGSGDGAGQVQEPPTRQYTQTPAERKAKARGIGSLLADIDETGQMAVESTVSIELQPRWVSEEQAAGYSIVNGATNGIHDRAAALAGTDGRTAPILLLNRDFRGYQAILSAINDWANPEGDENKSAKISLAAEEWVEQKMIEAVQGLRQLENGRTWITQHYDDAMSPTALTVAFMADRYHTLSEVKRIAGSLRSGKKEVPEPEGA